MDMEVIMNLKKLSLFLFFSLGTALAYGMQVSNSNSDIETYGSECIAIGNDMHIVKMLECKGSSRIVHEFQLFKKDKEIGYVKFTYDTKYQFGYINDLHIYSNGVMGVKQNNRAQGSGSLLLNLAIKELRTYPCTNIQLKVSPYDKGKLSYEEATKKLFGFYAKHGFKVFPENGMYMYVDCNELAAQETNTAKLRATEKEHAEKMATRTRLVVGVSCAQLVFVAGVAGAMAKL